jgi:hypothetical protein
LLRNFLAVPQGNTISPLIEFILHLVYIQLIGLIRNIFELSGTGFAQMNLGVGVLSAQNLNLLRLKTGIQPVRHLILRLNDGQLPINSPTAQLSHE